MKKAGKIFLILILLLLDFAALDDITTGNEPTYLGEYLFLGFSVLVFGLLAYIYKKTKEGADLKTLKFTLLYGVLLWVIGFAVAFLAFGIRQNNRPLFESIMPVGLSLGTVFFSYQYFKRFKKNYFRESVKLGVSWLAISLLLDSLMFFDGPMKMSLSEYVSDIGVTYLMIPIITAGFGYVLEKK